MKSYAKVPTNMEPVPYEEGMKELDRLLKAIVQTEALNIQFIALAILQTIRIGLSEHSVKDLITALVNHASLYTKEHNHDK